MKPSNRDQDWAEAAPLLARALRDSDDTVEELRQACRDGIACLLVDEAAYCVLSPVAHAGGVDLLVWAAVSRGPVGLLKAWVPRFEEFARSLGVRRLAFKTAPRRAYERLLPDGWAPRQVLWAKEV